MKEKPEEFKNTPVVITKEECKAIMDDAMKDQADYPNPLITLRWEGTYVDERCLKLNDVLYMGPGDGAAQRVSWENFMAWAIAEARLLERLMDSIPKPPKKKAGAPFNASLFDFYTNAVLIGEKDNHLSDVILVSGVNKSEYHVHRVVLASASRYLLEVFKANPPFSRKRSLKPKPEGAAATDNLEPEYIYEWVVNFDKITIPAPIITASSKAPGKSSDD